MWKMSLIVRKINKTLFEHHSKTIIQHYNGSLRWGPINRFVYLSTKVATGSLSMSTKCYNDLDITLWIFYGINTSFAKCLN